LRVPAAFRVVTLKKLWVFRKTTRWPRATGMGWLFETNVASDKTAAKINTLLAQYRALVVR